MEGGKDESTELDVAAAATADDDEGPLVVLPKAGVVATLLFPLLVPLALTS
jgi:hypothetical protein